MKSNVDIRREARGIVKSPWFWRLAAVMCTLQMIMQVVGALVSRLVNHLQAQSWTDFCFTKVSMLGNGIPFSVPSQRCAWQMTGVTAFELFVSYIFGAIVAYGYARVVLKAVDNESSRWFADSFEGFRRPFQMAWLLLLMNVRILLWSCVCIVPGIVSIYRYRQAWYLKCLDSDRSARDCIGMSSRMMDGHKGQAFRLDLSFVGWLAATGILAGCAAGARLSGGGGVTDALGFFLGVAAGVLLFYVLTYYFVARALFFKHLNAESASCEAVTSR